MSESDWAVSVARDRAEQITAMRAAGFDVGVRPLRRLNEELMSAPPAIALQLGVRGLDESATEQRRFLADKLQWLAVADFAQAHGQVAALEPSAPFGLALIRAHRGDLAGALGSPYATAQMNIEMRRYFDNNGWVQDQGEWVMAQPPRLDTMLQGRELFKQAVTFTIEDALSGTDQPRVPANPWAYLDRNGVAAPTRNRYAIPAPVWETVTPRPPSPPGRTPRGLPAADRPRPCPLTAHRQSAAPTRATCRGIGPGKETRMAEYDTPITDRVLVAHDLLDEIERARIEGRDQAAIDTLVAEYRGLRREL